MSSTVLMVVKIPTAEQQFTDYKAKAGVFNSNSNQSSLQFHFTPLQDKLKLSLEQLKISDAIWQMSQQKNSWRVSFTCQMEDTDPILEHLASKSIGSYKDTYVGILPYSFILQDNDFTDQIFGLEDSTNGQPKPVNCNNGSVNEGFHFDDEVDENVKKYNLNRKSNDFKGFQEKFLRSITARMTVAQVAASIKAGADMTFDFLIYILMAAWIAAMGLLENSLVNLVAAMLVSPLMGPVLALSFGTITRNTEIRNMGIRNFFYGALMAISLGYIFGLIAFNCYDKWYPDMVFPSDEMRGRGELRNLVIGTLVALPSGAAVSLSILSGAQCSLIGVAISASLLPPCVNTGLLWAKSTLHLIHSYHQDIVPHEFNGQMISAKPSLLPSANYKPLYYPHNIIYECLVLGVVSFLLTAVNVISMYFSGLLFLKIKEITPEAIQSSSTARFFKEDIRIAREYNRTPGKYKNLPNGDFGQEIISEWADANGLNARQILSDESPESRVIQLHTLHDIMSDVESDHVFQTVRRGSVSVSPCTPDLMMRAAPPLHLIARSTSLVAGPSGMYRRRKTVAGSPTTPTSSVEIPIRPDIPLSEVRRRGRRDSAALLRNLSTADHLPYSVWPKTRRDSQPVTPDTLLTPISMLGDGAKYKLMSKTALRSYEEEMNQGDEAEEVTGASREISSSKC